MATLCNIHILLGYQVVPTTFQRELDRYSRLVKLLAYPVPSMYCILTYVYHKNQPFMSEIYFHTWMGIYFAENLQVSSLNLTSRKRAAKDIWFPAVETAGDVK